MPRGSPSKKAVSAPQVGRQERAHGQAGTDEVAILAPDPTPRNQRDSTTLARMGPSNGRWNGGERITHHGYLMLFVGREHPLADVKGYAYAHLLIWAAAGRLLPRPGEELHHRDDQKTHNRLSNLELTTTAEHARRHAATKLRDGRGRFAGMAMREVVG